MARFSTSNRPLLWAAAVAMGMGSVGCQMSSQSDASMKKQNDTVVMGRSEVGESTLVRVYSLNGVGLKDAMPEEVHAFTSTIRDMVVTKEWDRADSRIQVFGLLMSVRTTPDNHMLIDEYLRQIRSLAAAN